MKTRQRIPILLTSLLGVALTVGAAAAAGTTLWFDDENTDQCDDPFVESGYTSWLTSTTSADCDGGGNCDFGWSEGVIYMHPVRLMIDLTAGDPVDSVTVHYWDPDENDMRVILYDGLGGVIDRVEGEFYGEALTVRSGGASAATLAISACDGEMYEAELYSTATTNVGGPPALSVSLAPPRPNPFNPTCELNYVTEFAQRVTLEIFDGAGRRIRTLVDGDLVGPGRHVQTWDGHTEMGAPAASGTYVARLRSAAGATSRCLTLLK